MKFQQMIQDKFLIGLLTAICFLILPTVCAAQVKIAFTSNRDSGVDSEIYVMNTDGSNQMRLTNNTAVDEDPSFSSDGNKIAFVSSRDGNYEIYVMNADGSNQVRLTNNSAFDIDPSFSPDGSKIAFVSFRNGILQIYVVNADGSNLTPLTNNTGDNLNPSFSSDGSKIAFSSNRDGNLEIYVMNADGSNQTRRTNNPAVDFRPSFSPDGSKIAFSSNRTDNAANQRIYVMNADGSNQTRLTFILGYGDDSPAFSPDGNKIAFETNRDGGINPEIYVMNADGSNQTNLTSSPGPDSRPSWGGLPNTAPTISAFGATRARDAGVSNSLIASVNDAEDAENTLSVTVNGAASASANGVSVSGIAVDSLGNVTANISAACGATNASFTLRVTDGGSLFSEATLNVGVTNETTAPTLVLPANIVTSLPLYSTDTSKVVNFTVSATDNCDANPTVTAVPASGSTFSVGTTTVNVTATDASGNTATGSFTVTVQYNFAGFFQPIDNLPIINMVSAGQAIPVKFSLSGNKGLNIFAAGFPASQQIACSSGSPVSSVDETVTAGSSVLTYDALTDRYIYVWKTEKAWRGTCRQLIVKLNDGSLHVAGFQFR